MRTIAAKYDWASIKAEYITSSISTRDLAEKYGIPYSTLKQRATKEHWAEEKKKHNSKLIAKVSQKTAERVSTRIAKNLDKELDIADKLADVLAAALDDDKQFRRHIVTQKMRFDKIEMQTVSEKQFDKVDMVAVASAVKSLQGIEVVKRRIMGILTEPEKRRDKLERGRFELEKKKVEKEDPGGVTPGEGGVVEMSPVMEPLSPPDAMKEGTVDG